MRTVIFLITISILSSPAFAQHDEARNAVRLIAAGKYQQVEKTLSKPKNPLAGNAELHFVKMLNGLAQSKTQEAFVEAKKAVEAGLPFERLLIGPKAELAKLHALPAFAQWKKQFKVSNVIAGPMIGRVTSNSVSFWLRTNTPDKFDIRIFNANEGHSDKRQIVTRGRDDNTGILSFDKLKPDTVYQYEIENTSLKGTIKTRPRNGTASKFKVAFGGGAGYVPKWEYMWDTIRKHQPDAMLMLGDNVYIDQPQFSLCQHYCYYRRQCRPEWKRFTASVPIYSIWDDHDFATNDCNNGPHKNKPAWKPKVWNTFKQNWINPGYGGGEENPGCWYDFQIGDVHFIMLDGRYYRHREGKTMLGPVQKAWLLKTLKASKSTFKILVSPVPFTPKIKPGSKDPWDGFPEEREEIFGFIGKEKIEGVFLVAADRHRTDLRKIRRPKSYDLYEFMSSRLTNRHTHRVVKTDGLIWGYNKTCSFGLMEFDTTKKDPEVVMKCVSIDGKVIHKYTLKRSVLK